eukprot:551086-Hanusia_phi.AAC.1
MERGGGRCEWRRGFMSPLRILLSFSAACSAPPIDELTVQCQSTLETFYALHPSSPSSFLYSSPPLLSLLLP